MFLSNISKKFLLSEAPNDENQATDEPMEQDADMDQTPEEDEEDEGEGEEDMGDDMGEENEDMSAEDGMDESSPEEAEEVFKKRRLLQDYRDMYNTVIELRNAVTFINYNGLSDNEKKVFNFLEIKMKENQDKLNIVITEQFNKLSYKKLMTIYMYIKMSVKSYSDLIKEFIND